MASTHAPDGRSARPRAARLARDGAHPRGRNGGRSNGSGPSGPDLRPLPRRPRARRPTRAARSSRSCASRSSSWGSRCSPCISWIFGIMMAVAGDLPQLEDRAQFAHAQNSIVYDINGEKIATLTNNEGRILISSGDIAPVMKEATVAIEDQRFYEHRGVDFQGIGRAVVQDVLHTGASQGASTITEQFVKNALRAQDSRTVFQKLREAALAYQLERHWDKDKILTQYLNEIYFGEGAYGIEEAAKTYFGWNHPGCGQDGGPACASDLLPWEAAMLAGNHLQPQRLRPARPTPKTRSRAATWCSRTWPTRATSPRTSTRSTPSSRCPSRRRSRPRARTPRRPTSPRGCASSWSTSTGPARRSAAGLEVTPRSTSAFRARSSGSPTSEPRGSASTPRSWCSTTRPAASGRWSVATTTGTQPFNLATQGQRQPGSAFKPFTLVTALEQGHSPDQVFTSAPQEIPYKAQGPEKNGGEQKVVDESVRRSTTTGTSTWAAPRSPPRPPTPTTPSTPSSGCRCQVGPRTSPRPPTRWASRPTCRPRTPEYSVSGGPFEPYNPALILGGLETGVTPLEMAHAYLTLQHDGQLVSGTMATSPERPGGDPARSATSRPAAAGPGRAPTTAVPGRTRSRPSRSCPRRSPRPPERCSTRVVTSGTGTQRLHRRPDRVGQDRDDREQRRRLVRGRNRRRHRRRLGRPRRLLKPMETEYGGGPVDGGTIPALIFNEVVGAYEQLKARRSPTGAERRRPRRPAPTTSARRAAPSAPAPTPPAAAPASPPATPPAPRPSPQPPAQSTPPASAGGGSAGGAPGDRRGLRLAGTPRSAQRAREVLAVGGAEAPRQLRGAGDADPRAGRDPTSAQSVLAAPELERRLARAGRGSSRARCPAPRSACPGPEHSSRSPSRARAGARISSIPQRGSSARISTAAASPSGSQTKLRQAWMPYERYT